MKRVTVCTLLIAFLALLIGAGFTSKPLPITKNAPLATSAAPRQALYYWYTCPDDSYNDRASLSTEEFEMWVYYDGVIVNTTPGGGTLVEKGFLNNAYPHNETPYYYLYAHFD